MAWTAPRTWIAGEVLTAALMQAQVSDNFSAAFVSPTNPSAAWTAFTPTLSGGWALGNSTYTANYMKIGRLVLFHATITIGSTATKGTSMLAALPVTAASAGQLGSTVQANFLDVGVASYEASVDTIATTTSVVSLMAMATNSTYGVTTTVTSTAPFTWATSDIIYYGGFYEAAS